MMDIAYLKEKIGSSEPSCSIGGLKSSLKSSSRTNQSVSWVDDQTLCESSGNNPKHTFRVASAEACAAEAVASGESDAPDVGSLSPIVGSGSFLEGDDNNNIKLNVEAIRSALNEMKSSTSNSNTHSGWTSLDDEDELDAMDHDLEDLGRKERRCDIPKITARKDRFLKTR
ncbi:hypothetical protein Lser_V15G30419 [Lactuca serriola]